MKEEWEDKMRGRETCNVALREYQELVQIELESHSLAAMPVYVCMYIHVHCVCILHLYMCVSTTVLLVTQ